MKKVLILIFLYYVVSIIISCGVEHWIITDIRFSGATINQIGDEKKWNVYDSTSVLSSDMNFVISYFTDFIAQIPVGKFLDQCYAYSAKIILDNELLEKTYSISFNRPFLYFNDTIPSSCNVFNHKEIKDEIDIFETNMTFHYMGADEVIEFSENFISNSLFDNNSYEVTFSCMTSDGIEIVRSIEIWFNFN